MIKTIDLKDGGQLRLEKQHPTDETPTVWVLYKPGYAIRTLDEFETMFIEGAISSMMNLWLDQPHLIQDVMEDIEDSI